MLTISLCMIVKNEEKVLARCLDSMNEIADEIIIVDTGSEDRTKEIAKRYTDKIYDFEWIDDFAAARNFAFNKASMEYILWTDADDMLLEKDRQKFLQLKEALSPTIDCVTMNINLTFDQYGKVTHSIRSNRLVKRSCNFKWVGPVHEYLEMGGTIYNSDIGVTHKRVHHDVNRNIRIYEQRLKNNESFSSRDLYYYANELLDHQRHQEAAEYYNKFLDTGKGWFEDNVAACGKLADIHIILNNWDDAMKHNLQSFKYDVPRAEACCRMGFLFLNKNMFKQAAFWYKVATLLEKPTENMGLTNSACWTWLPHLQLCLCYDRLGLHQLAYEHNEIARLYIPDDQRVLYNKQYFEETLKIKNSTDQ
ncbi:glycosyltransferase involved in cell wall biosynthesis [Anaerosolibacter carboniphilus]|uniref:Glycosyltransferase involved in cell wall biosynthesis n=1 Tax=Anaerosolibacter carboniphilus TaxID=1417629 RepID=A0A841L018_9FIRM|nr:glycosyltransferase family 2 protein [Anaerosolibacter carboniphilus]MBB6215739.1 glycosyltransferase involved in cell wall biosynthesis [Anaerosolibacter carboniphilus]